MPDFNPTLLRRVLMLRQFPLLATADLDELATIAENTIESHFAAGATVARSGCLAGLQLVIAGRIEANGHGWGPRHVFGTLEVFAGRAASSPAIAITETHTLELPAHDVGELLEDNFGLLLFALRELASHMVHIKPRVTRPPRFSNGPLGLVDRLILFRQQFPFTAARLHALAALADTSQEIWWPAGTVIAREGDRANNGFIIVEGTLRTSRGQVVGPGAQIGHLETLAGLHHGATVETTSVVRGLCTAGPAILDVLEDHTDVGLAMIASFASALLDAANRLN